MIENRSYTSKFFTADKQGGVRFWPPFTVPDDSGYRNPDWPHDVPTEPLPLLVQPGVRRDPMRGEQP